MPEMRKIRGNKISMIFQEPMTSLNPVYTVGDQIAESFITHQGTSAKDAMEAAVPRCWAWWHSLSKKTGA
jgi:peptide/nickel transport system ATP-binding protein